MSDNNNLNITGYGTTLTNNFPNDKCLINKNFVTNFFSNSNIVGEISFFAGKRPPNGWLFCNGSSLLRSDYQELSNVIGSTHGGTASYFNLPDFRSRVPICSQQLDPISITYQGASAFSGGNKSMTTEQLSNHYHNINHSHNFSYIQKGIANCASCKVATGGKTRRIVDYYISSTFNYDSNSSNIDQNTIISSNISGNAGGTTNGTTQDFLPPFCVVNFIIYTGKTS